MSEKIKVIVAKDGSVTIEGVGFSGPSCTDATRFLEEKMGSVKERTFKPEFNQEPDLKQQQEQGA